MRKRISRVIWSATLAAGLAMSGCGKPQDASRSGSTTGRTSTYSPTPVETASADEAAAGAPEAEPAAEMAREESPAAPRPAAPMKSRAKSAAPAGGMLGATAHPPKDIAIAEGDGSEDYTSYGVNPMTDTKVDNQSTFAIDVDTASYAIARRKIVEGQVPPVASVRVEEFVNYFRYGYQSPMQGAFAVHMDAAPSPFTKGRHILRVGVQGKSVSIAERKRANLVFLVDVSGSMSSDDKLGLAKRAMRLLVQNLREDDTVAMVTYAGNTRVVLQPTRATQRAQIFEAIEDLDAGGSTAMSSGIDLAYELASAGLDENSVNRVIVLSDGDANVGNTSHEAILSQIAGKVKKGVTLSTIGLGMGNYKDTMMEQLANKGNGNYYYIDSLSEAKKVFQEQLGGTLEVIAKDVKLQVEFDKDVVARYRLVGYENRDIADQDFRNDKVDAGEIGAGHTVTALYEVELRHTDRPLGVVRVRAKAPNGERATESAYPMDAGNIAASFASASPDLRFATAVMGAAEILRRSPHARGWSLDQVRSIASESSGGDPVREEFVTLVGRMQGMANKLAIAD